MIVSELEDLLAKLPDDMTVLIADARCCEHIRVVDKAPARRTSDLSEGLGWGAAIVDGRHPAHLVLRGGIGWPVIGHPVDLTVGGRSFPGAVPWWVAHGDEVEYLLKGRWPTERRR